MKFIRLNSETRQNTDLLRCANYDLVCVFLHSSTRKKNLKNPTGLHPELISNAVPGYICSLSICFSFYKIHNFFHNKSKFSTLKKRVSYRTDMFDDIVIERKLNTGCKTIQKIAQYQFRRI